MKTKRAVAFELNRLTEEQLIILGHLTYHAGKLWNQANYLVQNRLVKPYFSEPAKSQLYAEIGVAGKVNLPRGIRTELSCQTPRGAPSVRAE